MLQAYWRHSQEMHTWSVIWLHVRKEIQWFHHLSNVNNRKWIFSSHSEKTIKCFLIPDDSSYICNRRFAGAESMLCIFTFLRESITANLICFRFRCNRIQKSRKNSNEMWNAKWIVDYICTQSTDEKASKISSSFDDTHHNWCRIYQICV